LVLATPGPRLARRPVGFGDTLVTLNPEVVAGLDAGAEPTAIASTGAGGLLFPSPSSGRYYARPSPDKEPFVRVGESISEGQTVGLLEVMKTFTRVQYGGKGLPARAKIVRVVPGDQDDLAAGDAILEVEAES
jgi:acetyl-CoA carboxylase biotin carboxyl carrier protein